jgi:hypothetical protein
MLSLRPVAAHPDTRSLPDLLPGGFASARLPRLPCDRAKLHADVIDAQVVDPIRSIHLPESWDPIVRQMIDMQREEADPEAERKEIRGMLRMIRKTLKEKLALLERVPESAINRAVHTLLDLHETRENTTLEERKDLVHVMLQDVGVDVAGKQILWSKSVRITSRSSPS